jgi:hypothetical protein
MQYAIFLLAALPAYSQMMGMGMRPPDMPGMFHPVVGSGAEYDISTSKQPNMTFAFAIVGQEEGGYWMEIRTNNKGNAMVMKELMAGDPPQPKRMIMQANGRVIEMPMSMIGNNMGAGAQGAPHVAGGGGAGSGSMGVKVGMESVTVPAGTFECEHFTNDSNGKHSEVWISTKVSPYGLVKMTSADTHMELQKVLEHETSQIMGEPMKINIPGR